jgi:hypothetical protein
VDNIQSNTKTGRIRVIAGDTLTSKEGFLVKIANSSGTPKAYLPGALTDVANYVVIEGAAAGSYVTIEPLTPDRQVRVVANSTSFVAGDKVVAYASSHEGKATEYAGSSPAFIVGIAEESGATAGAYLLIRPLLSYWTA